MYRCQSNYFLKRRTKKMQRQARTSENLIICDMTCQNQAEVGKFEVAVMVSWMSETHFLTTFSFLKFLLQSSSYWQNYQNALSNQELLLLFTSFVGKFLMNFIFKTIWIYRKISHYLHFCGLIIFETKLHLNCHNSANNHATNTK